ncbi:MAG: phosphonate ABC transporter ATP-binding protein [Nitrospinaceae bacterium]
MLRIEGLSKTYKDGTPALNNVSFSLKPGEFAVVLGKSGAGKSTLIRCINRLVEPSGGRVFLDDEEITGASPASLRSLRRRIGMVFQQYNLVKQLSVKTNALCGRLGTLSSWAGLVNYFPAPDTERLQHILDDLEIGGKLHQRADTLSGGQQQRVGIARALMQEPELILADEPVSSLDPASARNIMDILRRINRDRGVTVLCNLHLPELAKEYGGRALVLRSGEIVFDGPPEDLDLKNLDALYGPDE